MSFGARLNALANVKGSAPAIKYRPTTGSGIDVSWRDLASQSNRFARCLASIGVTPKSRVVVSIRNSPDTYVACAAVWKLGATVILLNWSAPIPERDAVLELVQPSVVVGSWDEAPAFPNVLPPSSVELNVYPDSGLDDVISDPGIGIPTGGSTGRAKIVLSPGPWTRVPGKPTVTQARLGYQSEEVQLIAAPLYHSISLWGFAGLFDGQALVLMDRFDAESAVRLIENEGVTFAFLVPTMMGRMLKVPRFESRNFPSLRALAHAGAGCPEWVKREWIRKLGPTHIFEGYGVSEGFYTTHIRGDEWLLHPKSVGTPSLCDMKILDEHGKAVEPGTVGLVYGRSHSAAPTFEYLGAPPPDSTADGFMTVGDLAWMDKDGYFFSADRRVDMILRGGQNIYPAEVEQVLSAHPDVVDCVVVGLRDADLGTTVHAIVQPRVIGSPPPTAELREFVAARLARYKVPSTFEFVQALPRDDAGKIRRGQLVRDRAGEP
jgi:bile acid-coenzyme A ligase